MLLYSISERYSRRNQDAANGFTNNRLYNDLKEARSELINCVLQAIKDECNFDTAYLGMGEDVESWIQSPALPADNDSFSFADDDVSLTLFPNSAFFTHCLIGFDYEFNIIEIDTDANTIKPMDD